MKIEEIRGKSEDELATALEKMKQEMFSIRFRRATETSANPARIRTLRRAIARVTTVIHQRGGAAAPTVPGNSASKPPAKAPAKAPAKTKQAVQAGKKGAR